MNVVTTTRRKPPAPMQPLSGDELRHWRIAHELSLKEMEHLTGVPWTTLKGLEGGRSVNTSPWWRPLYIMLRQHDELAELRRDKAALMRLLRQGNER